MKLLAVVAVVLGCSGSKPEIGAPRPASGELEVEIGAVALGAYCTPTRVDTETKTEAQQRSCEPGSVTLSLHSGARGETVKVERVEVRDGDKLVGTLAIEKPTIWTTAGQYEAWDQTIGADQTAMVNYTLAGIDWSKVDGGREAMHARAFQVTVVIAVGSTQRTLEKTIGAYIEDMVET